MLTGVRTMRCHPCTARRNAPALAACAKGRAAMALSKLSGDEQGIIFSKLCNALDPGAAVAFSSTSSELRALTQALLQQLRADHEVAAALCLKVGLRSCKELRERKKVVCAWVFVLPASVAICDTRKTPEVS
eukprot:scaffold26268_cov59-Phaeocystis_antarctica.AAC.2